MPGDRKPRAPRGRNMKTPLQLAVSETLVLEMFVAGATHGQIADRLGIGQPRVSTVLASALAKRAERDPIIGEQARALLSDRLDLLLSRWLPLALGDDTTPPSEKAAELVLKILDRIAKISGVDIAPTVVNFTQINVEGMRDSIMASLDEVAERREAVEAILVRDDEGPPQLPPGGPA